MFYSQSKGQLNALAGAAGVIVGIYAGIGAGKNDPASQCIKNVGPLPRGRYGLGPLMIHPPGDPLRHLGPCIELTPDPSNDMCGRSGFFIHLDNPAHPGFSSNGCLVPQNDRDFTGLSKLQLIDEWRQMGDNVLTVDS